MWTSGAHFADWCFLLVRTDPEAPKHHGISYLLVDMKTPGITARPLVLLNGHRHFNDVLFEDVGVPKENLVAAWAVDQGEIDAPLAVAMAKAAASDMARKVAGTGIQLHGGIGMTWEHDLQLYFKRAKASEVAFGDATWHRERVARLSAPRLHGARASRMIA